MICSKELRVLDTYQPTHVDRVSLLQKFYENDAMMISAPALDLLRHMDDLSLPYPIELVLVGLCDLPGYGLQEKYSESQFEDALDRLYADVPDQETWYRLVTEKLGLELCPPVVGPLLALNLKWDPQIEELAIAMNPLTSSRSHGRSIFLIASLIHKTVLNSDNDASPIGAFSKDIWVFARRI